MGASHGNDYDDKAITQGSPVVRGVKGSYYQEIARRSPGSNDIDAARRVVEDDYQDRLFPIALRTADWGRVF